MPSITSISFPSTLPGTNQCKTYGLDGLGNWKTRSFAEVGSGGSTTSSVESRTYSHSGEISSAIHFFKRKSPFTP